MSNSTFNKPSTAVSRTVLRDAVANVVWFGAGAAAIILIGGHSRGIGLSLAAVEGLLAAVQSLKVIFILFVDLLLLLSGKREPDEKDIRVASVIRVAELIVWLGCIFVLFRFFFP
jgi:hypothetical protein